MALVGNRLLNYLIQEVVPSYQESMGLPIDLLKMNLNVGLEVDISELQELYLELGDLLRYSGEDDPTADQAVTMALIRDIITSYYRR